MHRGGVEVLLNLGLALGILALLALAFK